jgi:prefoldin subunit 5
MTTEEIENRLDMLYTELQHLRDEMYNVQDEIEELEGIL